MSVEVFMFGTVGESTVPGLLLVYAGYLGFALSVALIGLLPLLTYRSYRLFFRKPCNRSTESGLAWAGAVLALVLLFGHFENTRDQEAVAPEEWGKPDETGRDLSLKNEGVNEIQESISATEEVSQDSLEDAEAKFVEIASLMGKSVDKVSTQYNNELASIGVWDASNFHTLSSQSDIADRLRILNLWDVVIVKYRKKFKAIFEQARNEFKAVHTNPFYKKIFVESYDLGASEALAEISTAFDLQNRLSLALRGALVELVENPSSWAVEDEELVFYDLDLMEKFNGKQAKIAELRREMEQLVE